MSDCFKILSSPTFWTAVGAISAVIATRMIYLAKRQLEFSCWLKAQEVFTNDNFVEARKKILQHFGYSATIKSMVGGGYECPALLVCRKMDELARLEPYLGEDKILDTWGYPLGKSWMILEETVKAEQKYQPDKWKPFKDLGETAKKKFNLEKLNEEYAKEKEQNQS